MHVDCKIMIDQAVLIVDDNDDFLSEVKLTLISNGINHVTTLNDSSKVFHKLAKNPYAVLFLDWVMPGFSGADILPQVVKTYPFLPVVIMTGVSDVENVVNCIKQGAFDYITKPLDSNRLLSCVKQAFKLNELTFRNRQLTDFILGESLSTPEFFSEIITSSEKMNSVFKVIETLAPSRQSVLITGETGVGKELIAKAVHDASGLKGAFVALNVAGLDDTMLTDTLFGHKRGAFTGATDNRGGLIEQAKDGTLFLDEIGDLSLPSQVKLLRLLQQNEYYRLGSDLLLKSHARIIAASNKNLRQLTETGAFRADLYYRIEAHMLHIPPLRERREDILPLAEHYIAKIASDLRKTPPLLTKEARQALYAYDFPGNVRELINKVGNAVTNSRSDQLRVSDFPDLFPRKPVRREILRKLGNGQFGLSGIFPTFPTLEEMEKNLVEQAISMTGGNRSKAADMLGISRPTMQKKLAAIAQKRGS